MTTRRSAILITVTEQGREVDYVSVGDPIVVLVDWSDLNDNTIDSWMPADIRDKINEVKKLPRDIPWRQATIDRLEKILEQVERSTHERV